MFFLRNATALDCTRFVNVRNTATERLVQVRERETRSTTLLRPHVRRYVMQTTATATALVWGETSGPWYVCLPHAIDRLVFSRCECTYVPLLYIDK